MSNTFYFVAFNGHDESTLRVIDLMCEVDHERDDWNVADERNFSDRDEAIAHARALARSNGLRYKRFVSRYSSSLDETTSSLS